MYLIEIIYLISHRKDILMYLIENIDLHVWTYIFHRRDGLTYLIEEIDLLIP